MELRAHHHVSLRTVLQHWQIKVAERMHGLLHAHAGLAVIRHFAQDGYNQLGDLTPDGGLVNGIFYNRWNYSVRAPLQAMCPTHFVHWASSVVEGTAA